MASSEKAMSFLPPIRDLHKLELHSHTSQQLDMKINDQSNLSSQFSPPLKLPQRRKFLTLATAHSSADSEFHSHRNSPASDAEIKGGHSHTHKEGLKGMDLGAMDGTNELAMAMEGSLLEEQVMEKKKLLVELAGMNSNSKVFHESFKGFHESSKGLRESSVIERAASNPSRICRFCRREFPSGRALGGHMRVHGALLDAHTSSANMIKQQKQKQKQGHEGKLRSNLHEFKDARVDAAADLSAPLELEERERAGMLKREKASILCSEERACSEVNSESLYHKLDVNSAHAHLHQDEERNHHALDLSYRDYFSGYGKSDNLQLLAGDCVEYASSFDSKKHPGLYELRRNPKPNRRFIRERYAVQMNHSINANCHSNATSAPSPPAGDQTFSSSPSPSPERARPCSECGKVFYSWKALFGHMRCHPEREWRGIQRPDSSVELDRTARMIARRPVAEVDPTELGYGACSKSNCMKVENTKETTHVSKEEITHANTTNSQEDEKTAHFAAHRQGGTGAATSLELPKGPGTAIDADCSMYEENKDKKDVIECTKSKHEALMHARVEETTDDWSPIWSSAGRRSKRRRLSMRAQPALTSETISNEIRFDKEVPECKDQEDLDMANCLVLLSSAGKSMQEINKMGMESTEESAFSHPGKAGRATSNVDQWEGASDTGDEAIEDQVRTSDDYEAEDDEAQNNGRRGTRALVKYQCSTCKKYFNSHQALGGHRASHRKMKGCFARMKSLAAADADAHESSEENDSEEADFFSSQLHIKGKVMKHTANFQEEEDGATACNNLSNKTQSKKKFKGHECSICHRIFATGQALGGHKRCHWTGEKVPGADTASVASSSTNTKKQESSPLERGEVQGCGNSPTGPKKHAKEDVIDLNLPAPLDEDEEVGFDATCGALTYAKLRPPMEVWNPAKVAKIPQVCSMQTF